MEKHTQVYQSNPLFCGIEKDALLSLLQCMQAQKRIYHKSTTIFSAGDCATQLGIVLSGRINTVYEDVLGGRNIMDTVEQGQLFCDAFSCTADQRLPVSIVAQVDSEVLLIRVERILHTCAQACSQHQKLSENLVHILAEKYAALNQKVIHLSGRSTRRKLLSYLGEQAQLAGANTFEIPFTQQELADYLFTDRSGLSTELNRLKREGLVSFDKNRFSLHITQ